MAASLRSPGTMIKFVTSILLLFLLQAKSDAGDSVCAETMKYNSCASACRKTCADPIRVCIAQCVEGCECKPETPIYSAENGKCITLAECGSEFTTTESVTITTESVTKSAKKKKAKKKKATKKKASAFSIGDNNDGYTDDYDGPVIKNKPNNKPNDKWFYDFKFHQFYALIISDNIYIVLSIVIASALVAGIVFCILCICKSNQKYEQMKEGYDSEANQSDIEKYPIIL